MHSSITAHHRYACLNIEYRAYKMSRIIVDMMNITPASLLTIKCYNRYKLFEHDFLFNFFFFHFVLYQTEFSKNNVMRTGLISLLLSLTFQYVLINYQRKEVQWDWEHKFENRIFSEHSLLFFFHFLVWKWILYGFVLTNNVCCNCAIMALPFVLVNWKNHMNNIRSNKNNSIINVYGTKKRRKKTNK